MATLFISVVGWLDVEKWDATEGMLAVGTEVTVNGEKAGEAEAEGSHHAVVAIVHGDGSYSVDGSKGEGRKVVQRVCLRHRVLVQHVFVGITDDGKHDSYSMQKFSEQEFKWLVDNDILKTQMITVLAQHSDNAAQHFKSSKSMSWFTKLAEEHTALYGQVISSVWDFGCPGEWLGCG